jgi:hypothetical protein
VYGSRESRTLSLVGVERLMKVLTLDPDLRLKEIAPSLQPIFRAQENKSGIYVVLSKELRKGYVGQTSNFMVRWIQHYEDLLSGKHSALQLQRQFSRAGVTDFKFIVLEYVEPDRSSLTKQEFEWKRRNRHSLLNNVGDCGRDIDCKRKRMIMARGVLHEVDFDPENIAARLEDTSFQNAIKDIGLTEAVELLWMEGLTHKSNQ